MTPTNLDVDAGSCSRAPQGGRLSIATPGAWRWHIARPGALGMCGVPGDKLKCRQWRVFGHPRIPVGMIGHARILGPHDGFPTRTTFTFSDIVAALFLLHLLSLQLQGAQGASFGLCAVTLIIAGHELTIIGQGDKHKNHGTCQFQRHGSRMKP